MEHTIPAGESLDVKIEFQVPCHWESLELCFTSSSWEREALTFSAVH